VIFILIDVFINDNKKKEFVAKKLLYIDYKKLTLKQLILSSSSK